MLHIHPTSSAGKEVREKCFYVLNMDIFLMKTHGFVTGGLYSPPRAMQGMFNYGSVHFIQRLVDS